MGECSKHILVFWKVSVSHSSTDTKKKNKITMKLQISFGRIINMNLILLKMQYLLTNSLDMHSNYYNSIATVKYDQSVDAEGPFEGTRITCACLCHSDNTCASISYNKVLQMCWKHNLDPTRNLDKIQKDNNWDIVYTGTGKACLRLLGMGFYHSILKKGDNFFMNEILEKLYSQRVIQC